VAGTGAQIAALGPLDGLVAGGVRMAEAAPLVAREVAAFTGGGALAGVGEQAVSDALEHRLGSPGDYVGAALGGATSAYALRRGLPSRGGAIGGAVTSVAQDALNGREISLDSARHAAGLGAAAATAGGMAGRAWSGGLDWRQKGRLGEQVSRIRAAARREQFDYGPPKSVLLPSGRRVFPDLPTTHWDGSPAKTVEAKFGLKPKLERAQPEAHRVLPNYQVEHTMPGDIGAVFAHPAGGIASDWVANSRERQWIPYW
jgi:hypothetical protein